MSEIHYNLVLGIYGLWYMYCYVSGPMYHPGSPCGIHDVLSFGLLWVTTLVPCDNSYVRL